MKKNNLLFYLTILMVFSASSVLAQANKMPVDPNVVVGKLDNGLTYYLRHNELPKERADFYIVHNVGAILENDAQNGLAHFCEHMAFNGTKNYPKKGILNFLEKIGVKFGHNVNAFTGTDVTCYNLSDVPVIREGITDSALLILHDWSHFVSFEAEEIDAERGVIHEEWRTRRTADFRMSRKNSPILFKGSKYAERDVIGTLDVIDNCTYETMRSFYREWYRPDLQAIMVVGDFDVKKMEEKVKKLFADIPTAKNAGDRPVFDLPDNKEPLVAIATDPEAVNIDLRIYYKHNIVQPENKNLDYYRLSVLHEIYNNMINSRLGEKAQQENPPFIFAYSFYGNIVRSKDAYISIVRAKNDTPENAFTSILTENERVRKHGFTSTELERTKSDILRDAEKRFKDRTKQKNSKYIWDYFENFLTNEPAPGIEFEYDYLKKVLPVITIDEINALARKWITDENMVITVTGPEKEGLKIPTKEEVLSIVEKVKNTDIQAYIDKVTDKPLVAKVPKGSKLTNEVKNADYGTVEYTLENGVKVVFKKTDFKEDEILMKAFSKGGNSLFPSEYVASAKLLNDVVNMSGIGDISNIELQKLLSGKVVNASPFVSTMQEGFNGHSSPQDFETMMQLVYLYFTNPRSDKVAFSSYLSRLKAYFQNMSADPTSNFRDSVMFVMDDHNARSKPFNVELLNDVDFNKIEEIYKDRFADASDFTFVFVGNIDIEMVKPLVETYLGSLPNINRKENWKDNNVRPPKGAVKQKILFKMEVPKTSVFVNFNGPFKYNLKNRLYLETINHILELRYTETIREKEGGSYGVGVWASTSEFPYENFNLNIQFDCDPEKTEILTKIVYDEINKLKEEGPSEIDVNKAKEHFLKTRQEQLKDNKFWLRTIAHKYYHNEDVISGQKYEETVKALNAKSVKKFAKKVLNNKQNIEIIMHPAK
ncbi:MAG: insulinase family protein [Bacteroidetes bacterium]|nr:insulinase family protein [Bacteroidota bacterium]